MAVVSIGAFALKTEAVVALVSQYYCSSVAGSKHVFSSAVTSQEYHIKILE